MKNRNNRKIVVIILLIILIISLTIGVSLAFFNYTRTGSPNTFSTGRIYFNSGQTNSINLSNVFPISSNSLANDVGNHGSVNILVTGDTTYSEGIEYRVSLYDVNNTINNKHVPVSFMTTVSNLGESNANYYSERGAEQSMYRITESGDIEEGRYILVGYIKDGQEGVNGNINITAYIDDNRMVITDTVENGNISLIGYTNGTTADWIMGREVFTTEEWNNISNNGISFKVKVEANEGIWVEPEQFNVLKNLNDVQEWLNIRSNITSIEFSTNSEIPANAVTSFDATDISSKGEVKVYTLDDGLGNNTYKAVICSDDVIYAPENSRRMFRNMTNLVSFNSRNFKVDNAVNLGNLFQSCPNLVDIKSLSTWNTSNAQFMYTMFVGCTNLTDISALTNWNVKNVTNMSSMFMNCSNLTNINALANWNVENVEIMSYLFSDCINLNDISGLANWNVKNVTDMSSMFRYCRNLININSLADWNVKNVTDMSGMFRNCRNLTNINALINWNLEKVQNIVEMLIGCINIEEINLENWKTSSLENMSNMFGMWDDNGQALLTSKLKRIILSNKFDTSKVTNMYALFANNTQIEDYSFLAYLNTENVENMQQMFLYNYGLTNLNNLSTWNVGKVTNMITTFGFCSNLQDASGINNWNINANADFRSMFAATPVHPNFAMVNGTWDNNGSFIPS